MCTEHSPPLPGKVLPGALTPAHAPDSQDSTCGALMCSKSAKSAIILPTNELAQDQTSLSRLGRFSNVIGTDCKCHKDPNPFVYCRKH